MKQNYFLNYLKIFLLLAFFFTSVKSFSQTVLTEGDIAFTRINIDDESFSFVLLVPITNSTQFVITDEAWNGSTLVANESAIQFIATSSFLAGEEISVNSTSLSFTTTGSGTGTLTSIGAFNPASGNMLGAAGDNLFIYQTGALPGANDFITGINANSGVIGSPGDAWSTSTSSSNSFLPSGLTNSVNALGIFPNGGTQSEVDNARYKSTALRSGDKTTVLASIMNLTNWEYDNDNVQAPVGTSFTITGGNTAPMATAPTAPSVSEDATNVALANNIQITDAEATDTQTATFTITGGTLTIGTSGITFGGAGNGFSSFTAAGSLTAINAALDAATFTPTANLNGTGVGTIAFITNDGTVDSNNATITFDITAVNDEPSFTAGANETVNENGGAQTVTGFATALEDGDSEVTQVLSFSVSNNNNGLFSSQPAVDALGTLTYTPATNLFGSAIVSLNIMDNGGTANADDDDTSADQTFTITVNQVNNTPVVITSVSDDTGSSTTDYITNDNTPTVNGTAEPGSTITLVVNGTSTALFGITVTTNSMGVFAFPFPAAFGSLPNATATLSADATLNGTTLSSSNQPVTVDTAAPKVPTVITQTTNDVTPTITGTNSLGTALPTGETMTVSINGATYNVVPNGTGNWSLDTGVDTPVAGMLGTFINGVSFEVVATVTDIAGNTATDISNFEITVDTTNPADAVVTNPVSTITVNKTTQTLSGTHIDNGVIVNAYADTNNDGTADNTISLGSATVTGNTWSITVSLTVENNNNFVITAEDAAGNTSNNVDVPTITQTAAVTWVGITSNNWSEPSNWNTNTTPTATSNVIIPAGTPFPVTSFISVTVNTINIESGASLIANSTVNAQVTYNRTLPTTNWYLIAAPLNNVTQDTTIANNTFASGTGSNIGIGVYDNDGSIPWTYANLASTGPIVRGYGVSMKLAAPGNAAITGNITPFNVTVPLTTGSRNNYNLLGNPYTSFINSFTLLNQNASKLEEHTLWLWDGTQYITRNAMTPMQIAPTQGFFVEAFNALPGGTTNLTYSSANQSHQSDTFMRQEPAPSFELFVKSGGAKKGTKIFYVADKTTGFDNGYDSKMFGAVTHDFAVFTQLLSNNDGRKLAIQTLPNSNFETMVIPVGLIAKADKKIEFSIDTQNLPNGIEILLEDRLTNTFVNLSEGNHSVTLKNASNGIGQYYIHTSTKKLKNVAIKKDSKNINIYKSTNNNLTIAGLQTDKTSVSIYSILGKKIINTELKSIGTHVIQLPKIATGTYIIELNSSFGKISKKIIL